MDMVIWYMMYMKYDIYMIIHNTSYIILIYVYQISISTFYTFTHIISRGNYYYYYYYYYYYVLRTTTTTTTVLLALRST